MAKEAIFRGVTLALSVAFAGAGMLFPSLPDESQSNEERQETRIIKATLIGPDDPLWEKFVPETPESAPPSLPVCGALDTMNLLYRIPEGEDNAQPTYHEASLKTTVKPFKSSTPGIDCVLPTYRI